MKEYYEELDREVLEKFKEFKQENREKLEEKYRIVSESIVGEMMEKLN